MTDGGPGQLAGQRGIPGARTVLPYVTQKYLCALQAFCQKPTGRPDLVHHGAHKPYYWEDALKAHRENWMERFSRPTVRPVG